MNFKPNIFIGLSIGILLTFIFAFLASFFKDKSINAFNKLKEAEENLKQNVLGNIPNYQKLDNIFKGIFNLNLFLEDILFKKLNDLDFQEELNVYANNIYNLKNKNESLSFATCSSNYQPQFVINFFLSKILAEQGLKVLLIDCNLRKPFNLKNGNQITNGFSDFCRNRKLKIEDIIIDFEECPNLNFISSGNTKPNDFKFLFGE